MKDRDLACDTCAKAEDCSIYQRVLEAYAVAGRDFRRKGKIIITGCDDYEPASDLEE